MEHQNWGENSWKNLKMILNGRLSEEQLKAKIIYRKVDAKRPKNLCLSISLVDPLNVKTDTLYNIIMNIILGQSYEF